MRIVKRFQSQTVQRELFCIKEFCFKIFSDLWLVLLRSKNSRKAYLDFSNCMNTIPRTFIGNIYFICDCIGIKTGLSCQNLNIMFRIYHLLGWETSGIGAFMTSSRVIGLSSFISTVSALFSFKFSEWMFMGIVGKRLNYGHSDILWFLGHMLRWWIGSLRLLKWRGKIVKREKSVEKSFFE